MSIILIDGVATPTLCVHLCVCVVELHGEPVYATKRVLKINVSMHRVLALCGEHSNNNNCIHGST